MTGTHFGRRWAAALACVAALALAACGGGDAQGDPPGATSAGASGGPGAVPLAVSIAHLGQSFQTLRGVVPPDPSGTENGRLVGLPDYVQDRGAAIRLGKALFWDMNVGSDGNTACASCHFQAGADNRITNQLNPGLENVDRRVARFFNRPAASSSWGPNYTLALADFPLHVLRDPLDRNSEVLSTTDDVVSSQGVFDAVFVRPGQSRFDDCTLRPDEIFHVGGINTRRVASRNTPTVINAALNVRNFWDGRANNIFNGSSPFGNRDPDAGIWVTAAPGATASKVRIALADASAASQAVGPPMSDFEMSCGGRSFANLARRILDVPALNRQAIHPGDSVLAVFAATNKPKYRDLVQAAFRPRLWNAGQSVPVGGAPYSQMEANFALFFGLAIQMYEATLISDQTPLDAYLAGDTTALGPAAQRGMALFTGKGQCINCHGGPELTGAATLLRLAPTKRVERMAMGDGQVAIYDNGFYNIGVRPTTADLGVGAADPWGNPLSFTRQYRTMLAGGTVPDPFTVDPCAFQVRVMSGSRCDPRFVPKTNFRDAVDGSFKTPGLRNIALTGPYFHNGSRATLEQVVEFYNRGGDRRGTDLSNTSGFGPNASNLPADIKPLGMTAAERSDMVAFLRDALTDARVAWERAPFDHPSIVIPDGHLGNETQVTGQQSSDPRLAKRAQDVLRNIPAVGQAGRPVREGPLQPFHSGLK